MILGKIVGAVLGFLTLGPIGALAGAVAGHLVDRSLDSGAVRPGHAHLAEVQETFFRTVFLLLGHLAKADGRVSEDEIAQTEAFMRRMGLGGAHRRHAIELFRQGRGPEFDLQSQLAEFNRVCGRFGNLRQMLLVYLIGLALADERLDEMEAGVLERVAFALGFNAATFQALVRMIAAQSQFAGFGAERRQRRETGRPAPDELALAYQALGVDPDASDVEIKRAYRKLMSQYHPDKLIGQGLPEDMVEVATERSQEVQAAYDLIRAARQRRAR